MKIHEYQAKTLFENYGIPVDKGILCNNIDEVRRAYLGLNTSKVVIKAQVLTGGRGKAGGVKLVHSSEEAEAEAGRMLGMNISGFQVNKVLVGEASFIESEYYLSFVIDRNEKNVLLILCKEGGIDIEEVSRTNPERIYRFAVDCELGIPDFFARQAAFSIFDTADTANQAAQIIQKLYRLFIEKDASLAEINPLILNQSGKIMAIDAKMVFDDNALYKHPDIQLLFEPTEEEKKEQLAKSKGLSYVNLEGNIACMVNGAGLAMATMDSIQFYGGSPANFLDIGGSSNPNKVGEALKLLLSEQRVNVMLINIFGGITRCDDVAIGLLEAFKQINTNIPIVIRLAGTNEKEGRKLLQNSDFHLEETMDRATRLAIKLQSV